MGWVARRAVRAVVARDATDMLGEDRRRFRLLSCAASASEPASEDSPPSSSPSANSAVSVSPNVSSVVGALRFSATGCQLPAG